MLTPLLLQVALAGPMPPRPAPQPMKIDTVEDAAQFCFPSGLRLDVVRDTRSPMVGITTTVAVGAVNDPKGQGGAAHVLEHLWFQHRSKGGPTWSDTLDGLGATHQAFTHIDSTVYATVAPKSALDALIAAEVRRVTDPLEGVTDAVIAHEQRLVVAEMTAAGPLTDAEWVSMIGRTWGDDHPYSALSVATPTSVASLTPAQLRALAGSSAPGNISIEVRGDVAPKQVAAAFTAAMPERTLFAPRPDGRSDSCVEHGANAPAVPEQHVSRSWSVSAPIDESVVVATWPLPPGWGRERMEAAWAVTAASVAIKARLGLDVETSDGEAVGCRLVGGNLGNAAVCFVSAGARRDPNKVKEAMLSAVQGVFDTTSMQSLNPVRARMVAEVLKSGETLAPLHPGPALNRTLHAHATSRPAWRTESIDALFMADPQHIAAWGRTWLAPSRADWITMKPAAGHRFQDGIMAPTEVKQVAERPPVSLSPLPDSGLGRVSTFTLPNGLNVVMDPYGTSPMLHTALLFEGGRFREPSAGVDAIHGWLGYTEDAVVGDSPLKLQYELAASKRVSFEKDGQSLILSAPLGNEGAQLHLLRGLAQGHRTVARSDVFSRSRDTIRYGMEEQMAYVSYWTERQRLRHLYPGHPVSRPEPELEWYGLHEANNKDLVSWEKHLWRPENATLYVVGSFDEISMQSLVNHTFSSWKGRGQPLETTLPPVPPAPTERSWTLVGAKSMARAEVTVSCRGAGTDPAVSATTTALLRRLVWDNLRETTVSAYDPTAYEERFHPELPTVYTLSATVEPQQTAAATHRLLWALSTLSTEGPTPAQLAQAHHDLLASDLTKSTTQEARLALWTDAGRGHGDVSAVTKRAAALKSVSAESIQTELSTCVGGEAISFGGPSAPIRSTLQAAGWTPDAVPADDIRERVIYDPKVVISE